MIFSENVLKNEEKALYRLRLLYEQYGYARYKVSKFEEYDLYAHNKNFLVSENILTFTDTNGKLMALKPDVTLSIVKNIRAEDSFTHKLYYNENVYRTSAGSDGFREIMQTGLECIGTIDLYSICEVLMLAQKSLASISPDYILDVSHMGFLSGMLDEAGIAPDDKNTLLREISNKNTGAILSYCAKHGISEQISKEICSVTALYEPLESALPQIKPYVRGEKMQQAYAQLCGVLELMQAGGAAERLYLDFSMVNDMRYYNGIVFRGFINGIPDGILSGGRYDRLLQKMGKPMGAIGFAVYLNLLERFEPQENQYDVDVLLLYDETVESGQVMETVTRLRRDGMRVLAQNGERNHIRYRQLQRLTKGGLEVLETND